MIFTDLLVIFEGVEYQKLLQVHIAWSLFFNGQLSSIVIGFFYFLPTKMMSLLPSRSFTHLSRHLLQYSMLIVCWVVLLHMANHDHRVIWFVIRIKSCICMGFLMNPFISSKGKNSCLNFS